MVHFLQDDEILYFLHIEKTAGLSLTSVLDNHFPADAICPLHQSQLPISVSPERLAKYRFIRGHYTYALHSLLPRKPLYITLLRNPVARVISHYQHALRDPKYYLHGYVRAQHLSLLDFVLDPITSHLASNWQTRCVALDIDLRAFAQQCLPDDFNQCVDSATLPLPDNEILSTAKQHLNEFWFVGITERFQESLALLTYLLGDIPTQSPRINFAPNPINQGDISPEVLAIIAEHNQLDRALYDYAEARFQLHFMSMINDLLLSNHSQKRDMKPVESIDYTFDQPIKGSGWYEREQMANGQYFRWTGVSDEAILLFSLESKNDLLVSIEVIHALAPDMLTQFSLNVNDQPIPLIHTNEKTSHLYQGRIPTSVLQQSRWGYVKFALRTPYRTSPKALGINDDARQLGLAIHRIQIRPS